MAKRQQFQQSIDKRQLMTFSEELETKRVGETEQKITAISQAS